MNIKDEIKDIAPKLSQWKQKEGYKIPTGYFDNLTDTVTNRIEESKELQPYFQSLPDQVMNKIQQEKKGKVLTVRSYYKYGIAAVLLIVAGSIIWSSTTEQTVAPTYAITEAATVEESEDLDYVIDELSLEDIFDSEFIDEDTFDEIIASEDEFEDSVEDLIFDADDDLLEEFFNDAI